MLFKAVRVYDYTETKNLAFLKIKFDNKGIDALNLSNIFNQESVKSNIPDTFKTRSRHVFSIAIIAQMLSKFLITKEVCSKSTSIARPEFSYLHLVPVIAQN